MPTPQTNITLEEIAERFADLDDFVLCGHVNPDGDCIGSQLALAAALRKLGKRVSCVLAKPDPVEEGLMFLPGAHELVPACEYAGPVRVFVALDVPTVERIGDAAALREAAEIRFTVDHHATSARMSEFSYTDADSPSTTMLVWQIAKELDAVDADVAMCALCGLVTDTGRFSYQNTNPEAFEMAAEMVRAGAAPALVSREVFQNRTLASMSLERVLLERMELRAGGAFAFSYLRQADFDRFNALKSESEPLIDTLRSIRGVRVALLLKENGSSIRGSLRAKDDDTDVACVARVFGGGGHKAAAGFTYDGTLEEACEVAPAKVMELCFPGEQHG